MHKRITWLDTMRGLMIIFVIACHSLVLDKDIGLQGHLDSAIMYVITLFIMPCFFAISGFLYHQTRSWNQYKSLWYKKGIGLIIPYLILSVILHYYMKSPYSLISILYQPIFLMWFLYALFFIFIIVGTLDLLKISVTFQFILYLVMMVAQTRLSWMDGVDYDMNPIACIFGYLPFFYLGFLIKQHYSNIKNLLNYKVVTFSLFTILAVGVIIQERFTGDFPYNTDSVQLSDIITKAISVLAFFSLFIAFHHIHMDWLNMIGKNTLVVYLTNYFALHTIFIIIMIDASIQSPLIQSVIRFIVGLAGSLIAIWLVKRCKIIKAVFYPRQLLDRYVLN